jgi:phosphoserine phosphatase RsbU/P
MAQPRRKLKKTGKLMLQDFPLLDQLALKDRALARSAEGITIADARSPDMPLIYVNAGFEHLTGYSAAEVLGRNCRFLQGNNTDPASAQEIRLAIQEKRECAVDILNYRKNGSRFWNRLSITPIRDDDGQVTHFIGIQSDITGRKDAEEQLKKAKKELEIAYGRMKKELELAGRIQQSLLPPAGFQMEGVHLAWILRPCDELAGDALNVVNLDGTHLGIYMIDVSGHGVGAALLSVTLSRVLSPLPERSCLFRPLPAPSKGFALSPPAEVAEYLNRQFPMDMQTNQYFTFFYGILDTQSGLFRYVNAGHPAPILIEKDSVPVMLPGNGYPVGMFPQPAYREEVYHFHSGQRLYLYTDGVIEASNSEEQEWGIAGMLNCLQDGPSLPLQKSLEQIVVAGEKWCAPASPGDDISLIALEFVNSRG